jgi:GTP-binding protein HflX
MKTVSGNTTGLKPSQLHALERVYRRRLRPEEIVSAELGSYLCEVSREIDRQVGILVSRRGEIEHVFVGDASRLMLPEIGRLRAGRGRFRGLRLVHTHLRNEPLTRDDLVDLALLRLDFVAAIGVSARRATGRRAPGAPAAGDGRGRGRRGRDGEAVADPAARAVSPDQAGRRGAGHRPGGGIRPRGSASGSRRMGRTGRCWSWWT